MLAPDVLLALVAFAIAASATPGPNNLMVMTSGTNFGFARTIPHLLGISSGMFAMVMLVGLGLAQIFSAFPVTYVALKVVSVIYLLYLAWKIATAAPLKSGAIEQPQHSKPFSFMQALMFQWVNPKAWTMAISAVAAYSPPHTPLFGLLTIALAFFVISFPAVSAWTLLGVQFRKVLSDPAKRKIFNISAALLLVVSLYPMVFGGAH